MVRFESRFFFLMDRFGSGFFLDGQIRIRFFFSWWSDSNPGFFSWWPDPDPGFSWLPEPDPVFFWWPDLYPVFFLDGQIRIWVFFSWWLPVSATLLTGTFQPTKTMRVYYKHILNIYKCVYFLVDKLINGYKCEQYVAVCLSNRSSYRSATVN